MYVYKKVCMKKIITVTRFMYLAKALHLWLSNSAKQDRAFQDSVKLFTERNYKQQHACTVEDFQAEGPTREKARWAKFGLELVCENAAPAYLHGPQSATIDLTWDWNLKLPGVYIAAESTNEDRSRRRIINFILFLMGMGWCSSYHVPHV